MRRWRKPVTARQYPVRVPGLISKRTEPVTTGGTGLNHALTARGKRLTDRLICLRIPSHARRLVRGIFVEASSWLLSAYANGWHVPGVETNPPLFDFNLQVQTGRC